jgi:hypothetical protein
MQRFLSLAVAVAAVVLWVEAAGAVLFTQDQHSTFLSEQTLSPLALVVLEELLKLLVLQVVKLPPSVSPQAAVVVVVTIFRLRVITEPTEEAVAHLLVVQVVLVISQLIVAGRVMEVFLGELVSPTALAAVVAHLVLVKWALMVLKQAQTEFFLPSTALIYIGALVAGETPITRVMRVLVD